MRTNTITIGVSEAKARWSELVRRVGKGESFIITKRGKPKGMLVGPEEDESQRLIETTKKARTPSKGCRLNGLKIKDLLEEGRR